MPLANESLADKKRALRATMLAQRYEIAKEAAGSAADDAARVFLGAIELAPGAALAGYWPMRAELDVRPLLSTLAGRGHPILLPAVLGAGAPLEFREWRAGGPLEEGPFGTREPAPSAAARRPDLVIVPLLAFDEAGYRLGYGKGYYDTTLSELRKSGNLRSVGFAFEAQRAEALPHEDWDEPLDWVVTEMRARVIR